MLRPGDSNYRGVRPEMDSATSTQSQAIESPIGPTVGLFFFGVLGRRHAPPLSEPGEPSLVANIVAGVSPFSRLSFFFVDPHGFSERVENRRRYALVQGKQYKGIHFHHCLPSEKNETVERGYPLGIPSPGEKKKKKKLAVSASARTTTLSNHLRWASSNNGYPRTGMLVVMTARKSSFGTSQPTGNSPRTDVRRL